MPGWPIRPTIIDVGPLNEKKYSLTDREKMHLNVVDFVLEAKLKDVCVSDLLGKFTSVTDVGGNALHKFSFGTFAAAADASLDSDSDFDSDSDSDSESDDDGSTTGIVC